MKSEVFEFKFNGNKLNGIIDKEDIRELMHR